MTDPNQIQQPDPNNPNPAPTPPATPPSTPPTDPNAAQLGLYERLLAETQAENARLRSQLGNPNPAPAPVQTRVEAENFFTNPSEALNNFRTVLMQDVNAAIAPLNTFRVQVERQNIYNANKAQLDSVIPPHLRGYWPVASQRMDMLMLNGQLQDVSFQALYSLFTAYIGSMFAQGNVPVAPTPANPNPTPFVPPSIPSSPPPPPTPQNPLLRPLTENEKLVARASGMDDAAYLRSLAETSMIIPAKQPGTK